MTTKTLIIATRESPLAIWQAEWVKARLEQSNPGLKVALLGLTTTADRMLLTPLAAIGGKGLFVKELEEALLDGRADIAVHSMKDVPMEFPEGLGVPVMCAREEPRDALVSHQYASVAELPLNAVIGTASLRRQSQLLALRPDLQCVPLRGNVNTRLKKLAEGQFAAIILAAAGLKRLGLEREIRSLLTLDESLPAAGQGVLGIECRMNDYATQQLISSLNNVEAFHCVSAERAVCKKLGGNCQVPVAAFAELQDQTIYLRALVASPDGSKIIRAARRDSVQKAQWLGECVADDLLQLGAREILQSLL